LNPSIAPHLPRLVAFALVAWLLLPFLSTLLAAVVVVMVAWPLHVRVRRSMPRFPALAVLSTVLVLLLGVIGPVVFGALIVLGEVLELAPGLAEQAAGLPDRLGLWLDGPAAPWARRLMGGEAAPSAQVAERLQSAVAPALQQVAALAQSALNNVGGAFLRAMVFVLVLASLLHSGESFADRVRGLLPVAPGVADRLWASLARFARGFVVAAAAVAVVQGGLAGVGYAVAGVDRPALWGVLTGVVSVVPFVGTALVWVPLALVQLLQGDSTGALIVAVWSLVVVSSVDNVVRPLVIGQAANVHPVLVFLSVFGGLLSLGVAGILIGPMLMAALLALLEVPPEAPAGKDAGHPGSTGGDLTG
jgi:predicted PurR-regulated permease PerM